MKKERNNKTQPNQTPFLSGRDVCNVHCCWICGYGYGCCCCCYCASTRISFLSDYASINEPIENRCMQDNEVNPPNGRRYVVKVGQTMETDKKWICKQLREESIHQSVHPSIYRPRAFNNKLMRSQQSTANHLLACDFKLKDSYRGFIWSSRSGYAIRCRFIHSSTTNITLSTCDVRYPISCNVQIRMKGNHS